MARAEAGDHTGAIADFEAYIAAPANAGGVSRRRDWVVVLRRGGNPFSRALLDSLLLP